MRVLHFHSGNLFGGVERFLLDWMRASREFTPELQHHFALGWTGRFSASLAESKVPLTEMGAVRISRPWTVLAARRRAAKLIARYDPQIVIVHGMWQTLAFLPEPTRQPVVLWVNDLPEARHWLSRLLGRYPYSLVIAPSRAVTGRCESIFKSPRFETVPCLVYPPADPAGATTRRAAFRREHGIDPDTAVILQVGRSQAWKGHRGLLSIVSRLRARRNWELWLVGGPQSPAERVYWEEVKSLATRLGLSAHVRFWGQQSKTEGFFAAADVYCQLNETPEAFGIVFIEALYAGLPVVTFASGGAIDIFSRAPGLLIPPGSPEEAVGLIERLIDDSAYRVQFCDRIRKSDMKFCDPKEQSHRISGLLAGLLTSET